MPKPIYFFQKDDWMHKDDLKATNLAKEAKLRLKSPIGNPVLCTGDRCQVSGVRCQLSGVRCHVKKYIYNS